MDPSQVCASSWPWTYNKIFSLKKILNIKLKSVAG